MNEANFKISTHPRTVQYRSLKRLTGADDALSESSQIEPEHIAVFIVWLSNDADMSDSHHALGPICAR